jgi:hypothetical protein
MLLLRKQLKGVSHGQLAGALARWRSLSLAVSFFSPQSCQGIRLKCAATGAVQPFAVASTEPRLQGFSAGLVDDSNMCVAGPVEALTRKTPPDALCSFEWAVTIMGPPETL